MRSASLSLLVVLLTMVGTTVAATAMASELDQPFGSDQPVAAAGLGSPVQESAATDNTSQDRDSRFVELLNIERTTAGLNALAPFDDLVDDAALHTAAMQASGDIYHSSDLTGFTTGWEAIGENVGYGPNVDKLHRAFMASPSHRANIMGNYDRVGISSSVDADGRIYVTVLFMRTIGGYAPEPEPEPNLFGAAVGATIGAGLDPADEPTAP